MIFIERVALSTDSPAGEMIGALRARLQREHHVGLVGVTDVRRLTDQEVRRLRLPPEAGTWFEIAMEVYPQAPSK